MRLTFRGASGQPCHRPRFRRRRLRRRRQRLAAPARGRRGSKNLTIYSSLPLQGDSRPQSESVVNGEKLALEQAGGKVGDHTIKYVSLDDATAAAGKWEPGAVSSNARKAAQDKLDDRLPRRVQLRCLGDLDPDHSTRPGILQVSPSNTRHRPDRPRSGADKGEPDKYYPTGKRTYGRVVPYDDIQGTAQATYQKENGCTKRTS